jgi:glycosyltransferase involved in cell wall biosynthesis
MRILHVISTVNPANGGPIEGIKQFARAHVRNGHEVEVCSLDDPAANWVNECELKVHAVGPAYTHYRYAPGLLAWLRANVHRFDAVIINGIWQYHAQAVWRAARELRFPYFVFTHGMLDPYFKRRYPAKHFKKWLFWPWSEYRVLRDAESVLFTSETERELARESFWLYRAREQVVGYGIIPPVLHPGQLEAFHSAFPALRGKRFLLFLSRIHPKKGCDLLIEGFARATRKDPGLELVMAGPDAGKWQVALDARARELGVDSRIHWIGMVAGDVKWGVLSACEAFVLPSHQENFGIAVVEAMACRKAVLISTEVNIWREIDADGGGLVAPDTAEGATSLIERWAALSSAERRFLGERARGCFERRFTIEGAAGRLRGLLSGVAQMPDQAPLPMAAAE